MALKALVRIVYTHDGAQLKKPVTIRLDQDSITYFKSMSEQTGIPYQSLISLYLKEYAASGKKLNLAWK